MNRSNITSRDLRWGMSNSARQRSDALAASVRAPERLLAVEVLVRRGGVVKEICAVAKEIEADLIVMSKPRRRGRRRVLPSGTAERVIKRAPCPVLTLRQRFVEKRGRHGAVGEVAAVEMKSGLSGCLVRDAMQSEVRTLSPQGTLRKGVRALLAGAQQDFPVVENGRLVGMLARHDLLKGIHEHGEFASVASAMQREVEVLDANELLDGAVAHRDPDRGLSRPVLREGRLVGLLTAENLGEFYMIRRVLAESAGSRPPVPPVIRSPRVVAPPILVRQPRTLAYRTNTTTMTHEQTQQHPYWY